MLLLGVVLLFATIFIAYFFANLPDDLQGPANAAIPANMSLMYQTGESRWGGS